MWKIESKKRSRRGVEGGTNGESFQVWSSKKREKKGGWEKCVMAEVKTKGLSSLRNTRYYKYKQHQQQQHRAESKRRAFLCNIFNQSFWASWIPRHAAAAHDNLSHHVCVCVCVLHRNNLRFLRKRTKKNLIEVADLILFECRNRRKLVAAHVQRCKTKTTSYRGCVYIFNLIFYIVYK